jgi:hypothetical protein
MAMNERFSKKVLVLVLAIAAASLSGVASAKDLCLQTSDGLDITLEGFQVKRGRSFALNGWASRVFNAATRISHRPVSGQAIASLDGRHVAMGLTIYGADIANSINPSGPTTGCCSINNSVDVLTIELEADADGQFASSTARSLVSQMRTGPFGGVEQVFIDSSLILFDCRELPDLKLR